MKGRRKRHHAESIDIARHIVIALVEQRPFERRRNGDGRSQPDPVFLLQAARELRGAEAAIALACDKYGRVPKLVPGEEALDEFAERFEIAIEAEEFFLVRTFAGLRLLLVGRLLLLLDDAAEAGADRINENKIGKGDPAFGIISETHRRRRHMALGFELYALRTEPANVQIGRSSAGTAVEYEGDGPRLRRILQTIVGMEDLRGRLLALADNDPFGRRLDVFDAAIMEVQERQAFAPAGG